MRRVSYSYGVVCDVLQKSLYFGSSFDNRHLIFCVTYSLCLVSANYLRNLHAQSGFHPLSTFPKNTLLSSKPKFVCPQFFNTTTYVYIHVLKRFKDLEKKLNVAIFCCITQFRTQYGAVEYTTILPGRCLSSIYQKIPMITELHSMLKTLEFMRT